MEEEKEFYKLQEFADKLDVHHNTIRKGIKAGKFQAFRVGTGPRSEFRIPVTETSRLPEFDTKQTIELRAAELAIEMADKIVEEKMKQLREKYGLV